MSGEQIVGQGLAAEALRSGPSPLTPRERDVLAAAADSSAIADVSSALYLSVSTVRNYLSSAIRKTGSRNRIEAARIARHNGWL